VPGSLTKPTRLNTAALPPPPLCPPPPPHPLSAASAHRRTAFHYCRVPEGQVLTKVPADQGRSLRWPAEAKFRAREDCLLRLYQGQHGSNPAILRPSCWSLPPPGGGGGPICASHRPLLAARHRPAPTAGCPRQPSPGRPRALSRSRPEINASQPRSSPPARCLRRSSSNGTRGPRRHHARARCFHPAAHG